MPYDKEQRECTDSDGTTYENGWVVLKVEDGEREEVACVPDESSADEVIAARESAEDEGGNDRGAWVDGTYYRNFTPGVRQQDKEDTFTFEINNEQLDRHGTIIEPTGGDLDNFKRNPVVLWDHGMDMTRGSVPIGKATNVFQRGQALYAEIQFDTGDKFARNIMRQVKEGIVNGTSIGFSPKDGGVDRAANPTRIREWELVEISLTPTPSNPGALVAERNRRQNLQDTIEELRGEIAALRTEQHQRDADASAEDPESESEQDSDDDSRSAADEKAAQVAEATDADYRDTAKRLIQLAKRELGRA